MIYTPLLHLLERLRSIVISTSVSCVSVCPRGYLRNRTRDLYQIFMHVAYSRGSVLFRQGDEILRGRGLFWIFFPTDSALYSTALGPYNNAEPIEMPIRMISGLGPRHSVPRGVTIPEGKGNFGGNVPDKPNTPMNCELDWSMQRRAHDRYRRLIASVGRVYYRPRAKSDIYDYLVFVWFFVFDFVQPGPALSGPVF